VTWFFPYFFFLLWSIKKKGNWKKRQLACWSEALQWEEFCYKLGNEWLCAGISLSMFGMLLWSS
jgi:hypothetical protein